MPFGDVAEQVAGAAAGAAPHGSVDVAILGAGMAGLAAAARLGGAADIEILEASDHIGGRTKSKRFGTSTWANFGAQYVSDDKVKLVELAKLTDVELVPAPFGTSDIPEAIDTSDLAEIQEQIKRVEVEQARPRPSWQWELDDQTFAEWLGPCSQTAGAFWEHWAGGMLCSSITEVSLYGLLWFWGEQRTSPWTVDADDGDRVESSGLGACVVKGGTNELTRGLARVSGARISLRTVVEAVVPTAGGYLIHSRRDDERRQMWARHVICALPAPIAREVCKELPGWKQYALEAVRYGRYLSTPMLITPADRPVGPWRFTTCRPNQVYNGNDFRLRTPGDIDADGGAYHSYVYDANARQIWDDPDDTIKSGAVHALLRRFPQYTDRVAWVGIQRWRYGLPHYSTGHMKRLVWLRAPVGDLHFCGDYCSPSNMEGAARNGERAAEEVLAAMERAE